MSVTTVDLFVERCGLDRLDFVKLDVEGMEYEVMRGGINTWKTLKPVLYYETRREFERARGQPLFAMIAELLEKLGYQICQFCPDASIESATDAHHAENTLALPYGTEFSAVR